MKANIIYLDRLLANLLFILNMAIIINICVLFYALVLRYRYPNDIAIFQAASFFLFPHYYAFLSFRYYTTNAKLFSCQFAVSLIVDRLTFQKLSYYLQLLVYSNFIY